MKKSILILVTCLTVGTCFAQKKTTTSAVISFDATTSLDSGPKAENRTVVAALDTRSGDVAFEATVKSFSFANPMMQEHFNSKGWMDSDQFPLATFNGKITNLNEVNFLKDGNYTANIEGDLTIHGETNRATATATITVVGAKIGARASFSIQLKDYKIDNGPVTAGKVSKEPKISVAADF